MVPIELYLTGNDVPVYAVASLDLKVDGPTVVEVPPKMLGTANDALMCFCIRYAGSMPTERSIKLLRLAIRLKRILMQ